MGGGNSRIKVDSIPPTERLNLSKIGKEKLIEIGIKTETEISSNLWRKENKFVYLNHVSNYVYKLTIVNSDGSIHKQIEIKVSEFGTVEVATIKNEIYLLIYSRNSDYIDFYKMNEEGIKTSIKRIKKPLDFENIKFCGVKNDDLFIYILGRNKKIYKYNIVENTFTEAFNVANNIDFLYLVNNDFYVKTYQGSGVLNVIKDGTTEITEICQYVNGDIRVINDEIYQFKTLGGGTSGGIGFEYYDYDIYKFDFLSNTFKEIKGGYIKGYNDKYYILLPKMEYFVYAVPSTGEILRYVKELYLTEKREE